MMQILVIITLVFFIQNCSEKTPSPNATPEDAKFDALASNVKEALEDITDTIKIEDEVFVCVEKCSKVFNEDNGTTTPTAQDNSEQGVFEFSQNLDDNTYTLRKLTSKTWGEPNCPAKDPVQMEEVTFTPPLVYKKNGEEYQAETPQGTTIDLKILPANDEFTPPTITFLSSTLSVDGQTITLTSTTVEEDVQETDITTCTRQDS